MNALLVLLVLSGDGQHVKVTIGDEVFAVYNRGDEWDKPFFSPVTAAGGLDVLKDELDTEPADEFAPGNTVLVVEDEATLRVLDKDVGVAERGETLSVSDVQLPWLYVPDRNGWIKSTDVVPHKSIVTRPIMLDPPGIRDRKHPLYYDHPHHKGVWISVDEVHGIKFWNEDSPIRNQEVEIVKAKGNPAIMRVTNHWMGRDDKPILEETTTIHIFANRLMAYQIRFKALQEMSFEDTKEGLLGIRLPNSMREMVGGGPVVNADGVETTGKLWGTTSAWIDYSGPVGTQTYGATLMDHPGNFRPSRYHVRDYGLFSISPFGEAAYTKGSGDPQEAKPVPLGPGETLSLEYALYIHRGDAREGQVAEAYELFLSEPDNLLGSGAGDQVRKVARIWEQVKELHERNAADPEWIALAERVGPHLEAIAERAKDLGAGPRQPALQITLVLASNHIPRVLERKSEASAVQIKTVDNFLAHANNLE